MNMNNVTQSTWIPIMFEIPKWLAKEYPDINCSIINIEITPEIKEKIIDVTTTLEFRGIVKNRKILMDYRMILDSQSDKLPKGHSLEEIIMKSKKVGICDEEFKNRSRQDLLKTIALRDNLYRKIFVAYNCDVYITEFGITGIGE